MDSVRHQDPKSTKVIHDKNNSNGVVDGMITTEDLTKTATTVHDERADGDSTEKITYKGWVAVDQKALEGKGNLVYKEYELKPWDKDDVEIKVLHCGICGMDVMALLVIRVGDKVENGLKDGNYVVVRWQSDCCRECHECKTENEQACLKLTVTFNSTYHRGKATNAPSKGGFAKYWRGPSKFAIPIPSGLGLDIAGPLMCGGVTIYSPLERSKTGPGKKVGIVGVGGLGHMGIQFAKAMGAEVTAISRSESKKEDTIKLLGSTHDTLIWSFVRRTHPIPLGRLHSDLKIEVPIFPLIGSNAMIAGSAIGSPSVMLRMLNFAKEHNIKPWLQKYSMDDFNEALISFKKGELRYRHVLVNTDQGGEL
ncbi:uncharacterized protein L199_001308 [Kwoniella botswanensis]|uniref:uncharacterized protein n=1 Tax=Kwoniella botswanensis TaxID=1268659 RepID=UPI00315DFC09